MKQARLNRNRHNVGVGPTILIVVGVFGVTWGLPAALAMKRTHARFKLTSPVTVTWASPLAGSTISNTVQLTVNASSTVAPIARVEYYVDGKLVSIVNGNSQPIPVPPTGVVLATH